MFIAYRFKNLSNDLKNISGIVLKQEIYYFFFLLSGKCRELIEQPTTRHILCFFIFSRAKSRLMQLIIRYIKLIRKNT